jgi:hypothetical protein
MEVKKKTLDELKQFRAGAERLVDGVWTTVLQNLDPAATYH